MFEVSVKAVYENLNYLNVLISIIKTKKFHSCSLWPNASLIQCSNNIVSKIFHEKFFNSICVLLKNGLHFNYSEDVFIDYRKQLDRS
ncbi:hypothetical protein NPIL_545531, partial [Nephila pilipes]